MSKPHVVVRGGVVYGPFPEALDALRWSRYGDWTRPLVASDHPTPPPAGESSNPDSAKTT